MEKVSKYDCLMTMFKISFVISSVLYAYTQQSGSKKRSVPYKAPFH